MPILPLPPFAIAYRRQNFHIGGNPAAVADSARRYLTFGETAATASARMTALSDGGFEGSEGERYKQLLNSDFPRNLGITGESHIGMSTALGIYQVAHATALGEMTALAAVAVGQHATVQATTHAYNIAEANAARAQVTATAATATAAATGWVPIAGAAAVAAASAAQADAAAAEAAKAAALANYQAAQAAWEASLRSSDAIKATLQTAVRTTVSQIEVLQRATFDDNPSWLEQAWNATKNWVTEHADILAVISDALQIIGGIMMFIPGLNVVGAILVGAGIGLKALLAATGNASWGEVLFDIATCGVLGGIGKLAKLGKLGAGASKLTSNASKAMSTGLKQAKSAASKGVEKVMKALDPVDMASGAFVESTQDALIDGILPIAIDRSAHTSAAIGTTLGPYWVTNLDVRIEVASDAVYFLTADGAIAQFSCPPLDGNETLADIRGLALSFGDGVYRVRSVAEGVTWSFPIAADNPVSITNNTSIGVADSSPSAGQSNLGVGISDHSLAAHLPGSAFVIKPSSLVHHTGAHIDYAYDPSSGLLTSMTRSDGTCVSFTWDMHTRRLGAVWVANPQTHPDDEPLRLISYEFDPAGRLIRVINSAAGALRYTYDDDHRPTSWTDRNGVTYHYRYDAHGRVIAQVGTSGVFANAVVWLPDTAPDAPHNGTICVALETATDFNPEASVDTDDILNRLTHLPLAHALRESGLAGTGLTGRGRTEARDTDGFHTDWTVPEHFLHDDVLGDIRPTVYRSTADGDVWRIITPLGSATDFERNASGNITSTTNPAGATTTYSFNEYEVLTHTVFPDGTEESIQPGPWGAPVQLVGRDGLTTDIDVDDFGLITTVTAPDGQRTSYDYDYRPSGIVPATVTTYATTTNTDGTTCPATPITTHIECDNAGRTIAVTDPAGRRTSTTYDVRGLATATIDPDGNTTTIDYTPEGWPTRITHPDGTVATATYDGEGNQLTFTNEEGATTTTRFTVFDKPVATTDATGATTTLAYNSQMQPVALTNADGFTWTYHYNLDGQVAREVDYNNITTTFDTTPDGLISTLTTPAGTTTTTRTMIGLVETIVDGAGTTTYTYDQLGRLDQVANPHATISYTRNQFGRVTGETVTLASGETTRHSVEHTPEGHIHAEHLDLPAAGRFTTTHTRNHHGEIDTATLSHTPTHHAAGINRPGSAHTGAVLEPVREVASFGFGRNSRGMRNRITCGDLVRTFAYDTRTRLTADTTGILDQHHDTGLRTIAGRAFTWAPTTHSPASSTKSAVAPASPSTHSAASPTSPAPPPAKPPAPPPAPVPRPPQHRHRQQPRNLMVSAPQEC